MQDDKQKMFSPHEADQLAHNITTGAQVIKSFSQSASKMLVGFSVFVLVGVSVFGAVMAKRYLGYNQSDASYQFTGRRSMATVGGLTYGNFPSNNTTPTTQDGVSVCPLSLVGVSRTTLNVGESATLSVPSTWRGGSYHVTNPAVLSVNGNVITAVAAGTAQVYGNDFLVGTAFPCTADAVTVTVSRPAPEPVARFFDNHYQISNCGNRSATITAVSPNPGQITFDVLRMESGDAVGMTYSGPRSAQLIQQGDGSYKATLTVNTSHFGPSLAAIYRLTGYAGYTAVSHVACN